MNEPAPLLQLCRDALLHFRKPDWILSNPRRRVHVRLDNVAAEALHRLAGGASAELWNQALAGASGADRTALVGEAGLWENPTLLSAADRKLASGEALFRLLRRHLLLTDEREYAGSLAPLDSLLDQYHLGTFHQKVGQSLLLRGERGRSWDLWRKQKFTNDGQELRPSPYASVQGAFFDGYFSKERCQGKRILDFACGNGYYSARLARQGGIVTGIDINASLIDAAKTHHGGSAHFIHADTPRACLSWLESQSSGTFDLVYLSDIFLLLLNPEHGSPEVSAVELMSALRRLLSPGGRLMMMEPNGSFWLAGRYGSPTHPFALVPEYRRPIYHVAPTLDQTLAVTSQAGLALVELLHPPAAEGLDPSDAAYAAEFPMWDFMVFESRIRS